MEEARALGELLKAGLEAQAHHLYCVWDGEEAGTARFDRMGRRLTPTNCGSTPWPTSIPIATAAAIWRWAARTRWKNSSMASPATLHDPEKKITVWKRDQLNAHRRRQTPDDREEMRNRADLRIGALGSGSDYTRFLRSSGRRFARTWALAAKTAAASITPSTMTSTGTPISPTPISSTAALWRRPPAPQSCGSPMPTCCPTNFSNFADTVHRYVDELQKLWRSKTRRDLGTQSGNRRGRFQRHRRSQENLGPAAGGNRAAVSEFRASQNASARPYPQRGAL